MKFALGVLALASACAAEAPEEEGAPAPASAPSIETTRRASVADGRCTAAAIATGDRHTCVLRPDGTVHCWGSNAFHQLGLGPLATTTNHLSPEEVPDLSGVAALAAGTAHTCALRVDGTVACWGRNNNGQLGDGTFTNSSTPVGVLDLEGVVELAAGSLHNCARKSDGTVWCWGSNGSGRLGDGTATRRNRPVRVTGLTGATAITVGSQHSCALAQGGALAYCWGANSHGQLGDGTRIASRTPVVVNSEDQWRSISAGQFHTCGVHQLVSNRVECWGRNNQRQLGAESTAANSLVPVPVHELGNADPGLLDGVQMASGGSNGCVILGDGTARCWGKNTVGQIGDNTRIQRNLATPVLAPEGLAGQFLLMSRGLDHGCALSIAGDLYCWGNNANGQLGDGTRTRRLTPILVPGQTGATFADFSGEDSFSPSGGAAAASAIIGDEEDALWVAGRDRAPSGDDAWIVRSSVDRGATWVTRSAFTYAPSVEMFAPDLARRFDGNLYLAGTVTDAGGLERWLVRRSIDGGDSFTTVDDFALREGAPAGANRVIQDNSGAIVTMGSADDENGATHWLVRHSSNGTSHGTVDDYVHPGATVNVARHAADGGALGQLVIGHVATASGASMLIRRASLYWTSWANADELQYESGHDTVGVAIAVDLGGRFFAIARAGSSSGDVWLVRRSLDGGTTWSTADEFQLEPGEDAEPLGLFIDRAGAVQVAGRARRAGEGYRGVLRTSFDHGTSWVIADEWAAGDGAELAAIGQDRLSTLHVVGASASGAASTWVTRGRSCGCHVTGTCDEGPTTCSTILAAGRSTGDGVYFIDPNGGERDDGYQTYCDMTTDGGGWTLALYAGSNAGYLPQMSAAAGTFDPSGRAGVATVEAVTLAQLSTEVAFTHADADAVTGGLLAYDHAAKATIPDPAQLTFDFAGGGGGCVSAIFTNLQGLPLVDGRSDFYWNERTLGFPYVHGDHVYGMSQVTPGNGTHWCTSWNLNDIFGFSTDHQISGFPRTLWEYPGNDGFAAGSVAIWFRSTAPAGGTGDAAELELRASCSEILARGESTGDGLYTIDPTGGTTGDAFETYCDMSTDGGGWTLAAYSGTPSAPLPELGKASGAFDPAGRAGVATVHALALAQASTEVAFAHDDSTATTGNLLAYDHVSKATIPDPAALTFDFGGGGGRCVAAGFEDLAGTAVVNGRADLYWNERTLGFAYVHGDWVYGMSQVTPGQGSHYCTSWNLNEIWGLGSTYRTSSFARTRWEYPGHAGSAGGSVSIWFRSRAPAPGTTVRASCAAILAAGESTGDGVYFIDPTEGSIADAYETYCDMTTDGGGWSLVGYSGTPTAPMPELSANTGRFDPAVRAGVATVDAVALAHRSTEIAFTHSDSVATTGNLLAYAHASKAAIPSPAAVTFDFAGGGGACVAATFTNLAGTAIVENRTDYWWNEATLGFHYVHGDHVYGMSQVTPGQGTHFCSSWNLNDVWAIGTTYQTSSYNRTRWEYPGNDGFAGGSVAIWLR